MTASDTLPDATPARAGLSGGILTVIFVAVVGVGAAIAWIGDGPAVAEVGRSAPAFTLSTFDGESFDLGEHIGRQGGPVLLNLWASWCEPCKREFPALSDYSVSHPEVTVVGVAVQDRPDDARRFAEENRPAFAVGVDADGTIRDAYPSFGLPATFLIDGDGVITDIVLAELTPDRLESLRFES